MSSPLPDPSLLTKQPKFAFMAQSWIETGTLVFNRTVKSVAKLPVKMPHLLVAGAFLVSLCSSTPLTAWTDGEADKAAKTERAKELSFIVANINASS